MYQEYNGTASLLIRVTPGYYSTGLALGEFIARARRDRVEMGWDCAPVLRLTCTLA